MANGDCSCMLRHVRHHDHPTPTDYYLPSQRTTKAFVALWDIPENGGCTALVPKTHRLPGEPTWSSLLSAAGLCQRHCVPYVGGVRTQGASCRAHKLDGSCLPVVSARTPSATTRRVRRTAQQLCHKRRCRIMSRWPSKLAADSCSTAASGIRVSSRHHLPSFLTCAC